MTLGGPQVLALALAILRLAELLWARRNTRRLRARGALEIGAGHYPVIVAFHAAWLAALFLLPADAPLVWPALVLLLLLLVLRAWTLASLGERWTTRILVLPESQLVRRGPYRLLRHPNYLVVVLEVATGPLVFGAWGTALVFSLLHLPIVLWRIRIEEQGLHQALPGSTPP